MPRTITSVLLCGAAILGSGCSYESPPCVVATGAENPERGNAVCVVEDQGRVLLVQHRIGDKWGLPGGRRGRGETSQCTAHRETWEEAGTLVEVGRQVGRTPSTLFYACRLAGDVPVSADWGQSWASRFEITDVQWVPRDELRDRDWRYEEQLPLIERALKPTR